MERPSSEVVHSQQALLERDGKTGAVSDAASVSRIFANHLTTVNALVASRPNMELLPVSYHELVESPEVASDHLEPFLKKKLNRAPMSKVPQKNLYRSR
jgi:hypothetical protein